MTSAVAATSRKRASVKPALPFRASFSAKCSSSMIPRLLRLLGEPSTSCGLAGEQHEADCDQQHDPLQQHGDHARLCRGAGQ